MKQFTIEAGQEGQRLDHYLARLMPNAPSGFFYKMLRRKNIKVNGRKAQGRDRLGAGDTVSLFLSDETFARFSRRKAVRTVSVPLPEILYEDEYLLAVNKPAGFLVQPDHSGEPSLSDALYAHYDPEGELRAAGNYVCSPAHRLDKNTSGIVLCGKTLTCQTFLSDCIRDGRMEKYYRAFVHGRMTKEFTGEAYLRKHPEKTGVMISKEMQDGAERIRTGFAPVKGNELLTDVLVRLYTGKKHQIRAHLAFLGYPVVGDRRYGDAEKDAALPFRVAYGRQLLHAYRIHFPEDAEEFSSLAGLTITAPLPADMRAAEQSIEHD